MLATLRSHLTFANVVSLMALFIALSGGAYALTIPKNSVGAKQLKRNAITRSKIKKGAVSSSKVKDHSLLSKDFKAGQLPAGPKGAVGATGATGRKGDRGAPGATNVIIRRGTATTVPPDSVANAVTVACNPGEVATGGGIEFLSGTVGDMVVERSVPSPTPPSTELKPDGWVGGAQNMDINNDNLGSMDVRAVVVCASP